MNAPLPPEVAMGAVLRDNEYGWTISKYPAALTAAERLGLACLGGQLQFRLESSIFEAYWLSADPSKRSPKELWRDYVHRSCAEVKSKFTDLVENLDVQKLVR